MQSLVACVAILVLLSLVLPHASQLVLVAVNAPLAIMGGVFAILFCNGDLSLGAMVGFITLLGITLRNSVLMLSHYGYVIQHEGQPRSFQTLVNASAERLLPILMTAIVTGIGLLPIALASNEAGREIEGPMAIVILGGLITSTLLNLLVMPLLAYRFGKFTKES
jgi:Cu/Ag efflux pump CusA